MHDARDTGRTRPDTIDNPLRRRLLAGATAALATAGAAIATTAHAAPVALPEGTGDDAELIRLCNRIAQLGSDYDALILAQHTTEDEDRTDPLLDAMNAEQDEIWERLDEIDVPTTAAGAAAMARAALAQWPRNRDGSLRAPYPAEWLATGVLEFHAGEAAA